VASLHVVDIYFVKLRDLRELVALTASE